MSFVVVVKTKNTCLINQKKKKKKKKNYVSDALCRTSRVSCYAEVTLLPKYAVIMSSRFQMCKSSSYSKLYSSILVLDFS